jgi:hypothetical protein
VIVIILDLVIHFSLGSAMVHLGGRHYKCTRIDLNSMADGIGTKVLYVFFMGKTIGLSVMKDES